MTDTSPAAVAARVAHMRFCHNNHDADLIEALASQLAAAIAEAHDTGCERAAWKEIAEAAEAQLAGARDAALVEVKAAVGLVRVPVGSTAPIWDAMDAIEALRDKPAPVVTVQEAAKDESAAICVGCGQPATGMCWTDCGMSLCGAPICDTCRHIDETHGWTHGPRAIAGGGDE